VPSLRQRYGVLAEAQAAEFLRSKGFTLLDRHVTSRYGEIDLLMQDGETMVAVEVKARRNQKFGRAIEGVTDVKLERLSNALHDILEKRGWQNKSVRIDVVTVEPAGVRHVVGVGPDF
jgi:putative endonuclease